MAERPDPDRLLRQVDNEAPASARGRLKLFFGATPGVGKTYSMLEAAHHKKKQGVDVVVGIVETHGRPETAALLEGLENLERKTVVYKGVALKEFDLDAALARRPALILVDELAHTNAAGSRHAKRWQDVEDLLDAGIDVYTALNVQHWESLNDVVASITGVVVRETVPDTFLKRADTLELVDLPPEELLVRLKEGKVYRGAVAGHAAEHFFKPSNLTALRELALRHAAERVEAQRHAVPESVSGDVLPVGERLLVGISPSPMAPRLVRATKRLATRLRAPWAALLIETPEMAHDDRVRVAATLSLAEELGAETVTLPGSDPAGDLVRYAREHHITKIILGKPARSVWRERLFGSIINDVARQAGPIDLYVISGMGDDLKNRRPLVSQTSRPPVTLLSTWASWFWPSRRRRQTEAMRLNIERTQWLYRFSRLLSETPDSTTLLHNAWKALETFYGTGVLIFCPDDRHRLVPVEGCPSGEFDPHETETAAWVFHHAKPAGASTDTLVASKGVYVPIKGARNTLGVLALMPPPAALRDEPDAFRLLESLAATLGGAWESTRLSEAMGKAEAQMHFERSRNLILSSFSDDLREPLKRITTHSLELLDADVQIPQSFRHHLEQLHAETRELERLVTELPSWLEDLDEKKAP